MLTILPNSDLQPALFRHPHASSKTFSKSSPKVNGSPSPLNDRITHEMAQHRGLPPPAAMTLPDPTRGQPPQLPQNLGHMPAPPSQWNGAEEAMRDWLSAKAEEDRRRQEEEKTHQEELRLEQRRIEQTMLRESVQGGIPPHLVPVIFAGLGGGPLANASLDMAQQYLTQLQNQSVHQQHQQHQQQQQHQQLMQHPYTSPEMRQEQHAHRHAPFPQAQPAPSQQQQPVQAAPGQILPSQPHQASVYPSPAYQSPDNRSKSLYGAPAQYGPANSVSTSSRVAPQSSLPRLTTNEPATAAPSSYAQQQQELPSPSPSIFFHHWQPPGSNPPKESQKTSPQNPPFSDSPPRKRKNQSAHHPAPQPSTSPTFVGTSSARNYRASSGRPRNESSRPAGAYDPIGRGPRDGSRSGQSSSELSHAGEAMSRHGTPSRMNEDVPKQESS